MPLLGSIEGGACCCCRVHALFLFLGREKERGLEACRNSSITKEESVMRPACAVPRTHFPRVLLKLHLCTRRATGVCHFSSHSFCSAWVIPQDKTSSHACSCTSRAGYPELCPESLPANTQLGEALPPAPHPPPVPTPPCSPSSAVAEQQAAICKVSRLSRVGDALQVKGSRGVEQSRGTCLCTRKIWQSPACRSCVCVEVEEEREFKLDQRATHQSQTICAGSLLLND